MYYDVDNEKKEGETKWQQIHASKSGIRQKN